MGVGDGVDDELVEVEGGGDVAEVGGDLVGGADDVAGELAVFGSVEGAGGEGDERIGGGGGVVELEECGFGCGDGAAVVHADAALEEADGGVEVLGFGVGWGADDSDGDGGFGRCEGGAGYEVALVELDGLAGGDGGEEVGEGVGQAFVGGGDGGPHGGAEEPDFGCASGRGGRDVDVAEGMRTGVACRAGEIPAGGVEEGAELGQLLGEVVFGGGGALAFEGVGLELAAAGGATETEVDAVGEHGIEGAEDFGDLERGVVREHDAAGADADARGGGGGAGDEDFGCGASEQRHGVVLGVPEAGVAELVDVLGEGEGVVEGVGGGKAFGHGGLVEYGEA